MSIFDDAPARLQRYFADGSWEIYDGVPVAHDAILTVADVVLSVALNSQLDTRNKIWHVWRGRASVEAALAKVPSTVCLDADEIPWRELNDVFEQFCGIKYAKEAVVTKILHKKRPCLIPVYDRFIWEHFKTRIDHDLWYRGRAPFLIAYMQAFRTELLADAANIRGLCEYTAQLGWPVTPVRLLEVLIWMEYEASASYRSRNAQHSDNKT